MSAAPAPSGAEETFRVIRESIDDGRALPDVERLIARWPLDPERRAALALYAWGYQARRGEPEPTRSGRRPRSDASRPMTARASSSMPCTNVDLRRRRTGSPRA